MDTLIRIVIVTQVETVNNWLVTNITMDTTDMEQSYKVQPSLMVTLIMVTGLGYHLKTGKLPCCPVSCHKIAAQNIHIHVEHIQPRSEFGPK